MVLAGIPELEREEIFILAMFIGDDNISYEHDKEEILSPKTAVHTGAETMVLLCVMSPSHKSGTSIPNIPFEGTGLAEVSTNVTIDRVEI